MLGSDIFEHPYREGIENAREFLEADPTVLLRIIPKEKIVLIRTIMMEEFEEREDQSYLIALEEAAVALESGESTDGQSDDIAESYAEDKPEVYEQELAEEAGEATEEASTGGDEQVED